MVAGTTAGIAQESAAAASAQTHKTILPLGNAAGQEFVGSVPPSRGISASTDASEHEVRDVADEVVQNFVFVWGANDCGQCMLGQEAPECCPKPLMVQALQKRSVRHVFAGYDYSCVVTGTERLYAAGSNRGRLLSEEDGGNNASGSLNAKGRCLKEPQHVGFDELEASRFVAVSGGRDHLVAVTDAGAAISWGRSNEFGQLGHGGSGLQRALPSVVAGLPARYQVVAVSCGDFATIALVSSGELYAWGANDLGQLGAGDTEPRATPTRLGGSATGVPFRAVSAGHQHGLALSRSGKVFAWGNGRHGRLGLGEVVAQPQAPSNCVPAPRMVEGLPFVKHISAGGAHSAALAHTGSLFTAGDNRRGQLGIPRSQTTQANSFHELIGIEGGVRLAECGAQHTLCLTSRGLIVGFGCNKEGQLGTGIASDCEDKPVYIPLEQGVGRQRLLIYALAVTMDHSCVLAVPAPERKEQLPRYLIGGGRVVTMKSSVVPDLSDAVEEEYQHRREDIPASKGNGHTGSEQEEEGLRGRSSPLVRTNAYVRFQLSAEGEELFLLRPLVQPGVASREFAALSAGDLLALAKAAQVSGDWRDVGSALGAVLRRPSVLNASFHFPSLQEPRLAVEELHQALELTAAAPASFRDYILEAAAKGLEDYCTPSAQIGVHTRESLRGAVVYLLLPQLRHAGDGLPQLPRHQVLSKLFLLIASFSEMERREVLSLVVDEVSQASILREAVVPTVRNFLNERIKACHVSQSMADPALWNGALLMQLLYVANEQLREQQRSQLSGHGASKATMGNRFLQTSDFQMTALDQDTIPAHLAFEQLTQVLGPDLRDGGLPRPTELLFNEQWCFQKSSQSLPPKACVLMVHRNLVPTAFKQKVLQVSNTIKQHSLQERLLGPVQLLALLAGHDPRHFFRLPVRRQNIVEDTVNKLHQADPASMHFPLRVEFIGEEGLDEGGVRREFFQVLMRQLFDESYAMFNYNDSNTAWFSTSALETADTDGMYRACGTVMGLAVYNNEDGLQINFPLALFKKLKGDKCGLADLEDVDPKVWLSMQKLLSWTPLTGNPNREFEDTFCLTFTVSYDYFGETRTVELKPGGESVAVDLNSRLEYAELYSAWVLDVAVDRQFRHLADGFSRVVDAALWSLLTAEEAHLIMCSEPELDFEDLRRGAHLEGYNPTEPYIQSFWQVLREFDVVQKKKFLAFVTGSDRAPFGGLHEVHLAVQKNDQEPTDRLPTAHTCFKLLDLPTYASTEKLREKLLTAIDNSEGFGLE